MIAIREAWDAFQPFLDSDTPPPLVDADTVVRDDTAWVQAAQDYAQAKVAAQAADEVLDRAKEALVALAAHPREQGAVRKWQQLAQAGNCVVAVRSDAFAQAGLGAVLHDVNSLGAPRRHAGHSVRTSRCANTPSSDDDSRYGSTPMSARRVTALAASLVCSVASTR